MKKNLLIGLLLLPVAFAYAQTWLYAKASNSLDSGEGYGIATDLNGNVFICGNYSGSSITFGAATLTTTGTGKPYLVKYDAAGNVLWARSSSAGANTQAHAVCTDNNGNVFLVGTFNSTIGFGNYNLTSNGNVDTYIVKFDQNGTVLWAKSGGGTNADWGITASCDPSGNSYLTGYGSSTLSVWGTNSLTSTGGSHGFLVKYDPSGIELWALSGNATGSESASGVSCDNSGNIYMCGYFGPPSVSFGTVTINNTAGSQFYIVKFNSSGTALWAACSTGTSGAWANSVSADPAGDVYIGGKCFGNMTVGTQTFTGTGSANFTTKYSANGLPAWTKFANGQSPSPGCLSASQNGVFVVGNIGGNSLLIGNYSFSVSPQNENIYIANYDVNGNLLYASTLPDGGDDEIDIAASGPCIAYIAGDYRNNQFVIGTSTLVNTTNGGEGIFMAKLSFSAGINPSPGTATVSGNVSICSGQTTTLTATGINTYTWNNGFNSNPIYVSPTINTTYSVNGASACGFGTAAISIIVNPNPTLSIAVNTTSVCAGDTVIITASGANTYTWSGGVINGLSFNPLVSNSYTVFGTSIYDCSASSTVFIQVKPLPATGAVVSPSIICQGDAATLSTSGAASYTWQPGGFVTSFVTVTPTVSTTFTVTKDISGCTNASTVSLGVSLCEGILKQDENAIVIQVYPNPNPAFFSVELNNNIIPSELLILNSLGQIIYRQALHPGTNNINPSNLSKGLSSYVLLQNNIPKKSGLLSIE